MDGSGGKSSAGYRSAPPAAPADVGKPPPRSPRVGTAPGGSDDSQPDRANGRHPDWGRLLSLGRDAANKSQLGQQATSIWDRYKGHFQRPKASPKVPSIGMPPKIPASVGTAPGGASAAASGKAPSVAVDGMATSAEEATASVGRFAGALGRALPILAGIAVAGKAAEGIINYGTKMIALEGNVISAGQTGRGEGRRLAELQQSKEQWYGNAVPFWETIYNRRIESEKKLLQNQQTARGRSASLSQYDTGLSKEFARSEIAYQRADIGRAQITAPARAELERSTRELELMEQQTQAAKDLKEAAALTKDNQERLSKEKDRLRE